MHLIPLNRKIIHDRKQWKCYSFVRMFCVLVELLVTQNKRQKWLFSLSFVCRKCRIIFYSRWRPAISHSTVRFLGTTVAIYIYIPCIGTKNSPMVLFLLFFFFFFSQFTFSVPCYYLYYLEKWILFHCFFFFVFALAAILLWPQYNIVCRLSNSKRLFCFLCKRKHYSLTWFQPFFFPVPFLLSLSLFVCDIFKKNSMHRYNVWVI